ncbi:hypothetical protein ScPMuIL_012968 [Solemya velum]
MSTNWTNSTENSNPGPGTNIKLDDACSDDGNNNNTDELGNDAEGVWSPDIEQSFQEALAIYPPCGRRKIILSDEGKMYGRNELIARYIKLRTGKTRTRKQVSSHIQVLARRKTKEIQAQLKVTDQAARDKAFQSMASMSSAQIVSASAIHNKALASGLAGVSPMRSSYPVAPPVSFPCVPQNVKPPFAAPNYSLDTKPPTSLNSESVAPPWEGRSISGPKLRLVEFSAYFEQQRDPESYHKHIFVHIGSNASYTDPLLEVSSFLQCTVDIRQIYDKFPEKKGLKELYDKGPQNAFIWSNSGPFYGVNSQYESSENMTIQCSTKVCSFGKQVVEKVETEYARFENGRYVYRILRSPMCEYMVNFVHKLKHLPEKYMMNSVLENFTILQPVQSGQTALVLELCEVDFEKACSSKA